jgi:hypothetical protein
MPMGPVVPAMPVHVGPIGGPALPGGSLTSPLGGTPQLTPPNLSITPAPRLDIPTPAQTAAPVAPSSGGETQPEAVILPGDDREPPLAASSGGPPPEKRSDESGGDGGGSDGPDGHSHGVLAWMADLPGWGWVLIVLLLLAFLGSASK